MKQSTNSNTQKQVLANANAGGSTSRSTNRAATPKQDSDQGYQKPVEWEAKDWDRAWTMPLDELKERISHMGYKKSIANLDKADSVELYLQLITKV